MILSELAFNSSPCVTNDVLKIYLPVIESGAKECFFVAFGLAQRFHFIFSVALPVLGFLDQGILIVFC